VRSDRGQTLAALLLAAQVACFWPVWTWYLHRLNDGTDEPWAIAALLAAIILSWPRHGLVFDVRDRLIIGAAVLTGSYALIAPFAPPLVRALFALAALGCTWISISGTRQKSPAILGLFALSVPLIASLQFYAGFPMRVVTAGGATALLNLCGASVTRVGTSMVSGKHLVLVDAPCSGVRMLWAASLLCCVLVTLRERVSWRAMFVALAGVLPIVLVANILRATLLFMVQSGEQGPPPVVHSMIGIGLFAFIGMLLLVSENVQGRWSERRRHAMRLVVSQT
jgi:exosortase/archaeosortase family protein